MKQSWIGVVYRHDILYSCMLHGEASSFSVSVEGPCVDLIPKDELSVDICVLNVFISMLRSISDILCLRHHHVTARARVDASENVSMDERIARLFQLLACTSVSTVRSMSAVAGCPSFECLSSSLLCLSCVVLRPRTADSTRATRVRPLLLWSNGRWSSCHFNARPLYAQTSTVVG